MWLKKIFIILFILVILLSLYELGHWIRRHLQRYTYYKRARKLSIEKNKPLLVVGAPKAGPSNKLLGVNYGCGDLCLDIKGCDGCENQISSDLFKFLKTQPDNSYVIFISYVLEYIPNLDETIKEIYRVAGSSNNIFVVHASPWCLTSLQKNSSPGDELATNIILGAPPNQTKITFKKL
jgi:hypothetical protein